MYKNNYFSEIGEKLSKQCNINISLLGAGSYSYRESEVASLGDFRDLDFMIVTENKKDLVSILRNRQKTVINLFRVKEVEHVFSNQEVDTILSDRVNFIRIAGKNHHGQKISIKITYKENLLSAYENFSSNEFRILSRRDKRFFPRKSIFGTEVCVGWINAVCFCNILSIWGDKDFYIDKKQCTPGLITDMLITGKVVFDNEQVKLKEIKDYAAKKLVYFASQYRNNYPTDWSDLFVRGKRFPYDYRENLNKFLCQKAIPIKLNERSKNNLLDYQNYNVNVVNRKPEYNKSRLVLKKLFTNNQIDHFVSMPKHAIVFNSSFGKLILKNGDENFFKKPIDKLSFTNELKGVRKLSRFYIKIQKPVFWDKKNNLISYPWTNYQPLSSRFIESSLINDEVVMELELKRAGDILDAYLLSANHEKIDSKIEKLFFNRLTKGRLEEFYKGASCNINGQQVRIKHLFKMTPIINSRKFMPLGVTIKKSSKTLKPENLEKCIKVCGLGDGHFGNLLVNNDLSDYLYIDYEFSGNHSPYIDMAKPIYLDCFWKIWLGDHIKTEDFDISAKIIGNEIIINHNFKLPKLEKMMLETKMEILKKFNKDFKITDDNWKEILNSAIFCCAFLTRNISLFDEKLFLLNLTFSIIAGSFVDTYKEL